MKRSSSSKKASEQKRKTAKPSGKKRGGKSTRKPAGKLTASSVPLGAERFFERDESWMLFNRRVLEEAEDTTNPLLERVKFLAITASNLDEFFEIRVASLLQRIEDA